MSDEKEHAEAVAQHKETQAQAEALSKKVNVDVLLDKTLITDADIRKQYIQKLCSEFPQIPQETLEKLFNTARLAIDPGVKRTTMMLDGGLHDFSREMSLADALTDEASPWNHTGYLTLMDEDGRPIRNEPSRSDVGGYGLSYFSNPDRSDIAIDWEAQVHHRKPKIVALVGSEPYLYPTSGDVLSSKHRAFMGLDYSPSPAQRAALYHQKKLINNGFHGVSRLRGLGVGGHADEEGITYFLPRDYQQPLIDSFTNMDKRRESELYFRHFLPDSRFYDSIKDRSARRLITGGRQTGKSATVTAVNEYLYKSEIQGYWFAGTWIKLLYRRMGFAAPSLPEALITLRYNREYGHSRCSVIAPLNAGEFYDSRIPRFYRFESRHASKSLIAPPKPSNKGPKKRRHK